MRPSALFRPARALAQQVRHATSLRMPAMSPTMTEGGIAGWKKAEGESFAAGDVLLEVETDKATIDVEAQDDGIMGKIITEAGSSKIPVGQIIAVLAEEGEDLASLEIPKDLSPPGSSSSSAAPAKEAEAEAPKAEKAEKKKVDVKQGSSGAPASSSSASSSSGGAASHGHGHKEIKHAKPIFPSVSRLLIESDLTSEQITQLKGTGRNGMLTKGDVLVAIGQLKNPYGSAEKLNTDLMGPSGKRVSERAAAPADGKAEVKKEAPLDGPGLRRAILVGMAKATAPATPIIERAALPLATDPFDEILASYSSLIPPAQPKINISIPPPGSSGGAKDEWAGLF